MYKPSGALSKGELGVVFLHEPDVAGVLGTMNGDKGTVYAVKQTLATRSTRAPLSERYAALADAHYHRQDEIKRGHGAQSAEGFSALRRDVAAFTQGVLGDARTAVAVTSHTLATRGLRNGSLSAARTLTGLVKKQY